MGWHEFSFYLKHFLIVLLILSKKGVEMALKRLFGFSCLFSADIEKKVDSILDSWAIKYNVPAKKHNEYKHRMVQPLIELHSNVPRGKRPEWMDEMAIKEKDSFSYALGIAEKSYKTMFDTSRNLEIINGFLKAPDSSKNLRNDIIQSLSKLAPDFRKDFTSLNTSFKGQKNDIGSK